MTRFLKENFVLALGVSLPVLLIILFMLVHGLARMGATPPQYPVLYISHDSYYGYEYFDFYVENSVLEIAYEAPVTDNPTPRPLEKETTLVLYDLRTDTLETYDIKAPEDYERGTRVTVNVPSALQDMAFNEIRTAPDGYRFEAQRYRGGGFFAEFFGYNGRKRGHRLVKNGVSYPLPHVSNTYYYYRDDNFIGWVINGDN